MEQRAGWKERLADSSWVTVGWDWFMTLVGRAVEAVLWVTMALACYQLIPGAPPLSPEVKAGAFLTQFLALDAGGLGLYKLAEQQGLGKWASARVVSYALIGITLVTVAYAGIEHAMQVDAHVTTWVEISLVIARSIMTVLYGPAVQSVKQQAAASAHAQQSLEELTDTFNEQLEQLKAQLAQSERRVQQQVTEAVSTCTNELQSCAETLSLVPELKEHLMQVERAAQSRLQALTEEMKHINAGQQIAPHRQRERSRLRVVPASQQVGQVGSPEKFALAAFVYQCLEENSSLKIEAIQQRARACGQSISMGSISRYRKQYFEAQKLQILSPLSESENEEMVTEG